MANSTTLKAGDLVYVIDYDSCLFKEQAVVLPNNRKNGLLTVQSVRHQTVSDFYEYDLVKA